MYEDPFERGLPTYPYLSSVYISGVKDFSGNDAKSGFADGFIKVNYEINDFGLYLGKYDSNYNYSGYEYETYMLNGHKKWKPVKYIERSNDKTREILLDIDINKRVVKETNAIGVTTIRYFDGYGNIIKEVIQDANGRSYTTFENYYNDNGQILRSVVYYNDDKKTITDYFYNADGTLKIKNIVGAENEEETHLAKEEYSYSIIRMDQDDVLDKYVEDLYYDNEVLLKIKCEVSDLLYNINTVTTKYYDKFDNLRFEVLNNNEDYITEYQYEPDTLRLSAVIDPLGKNKVKYEY